MQYQNGLNKKGEIMNKLGVKYFESFKYLTEGRLNNGGMYVFNIGTFIYLGAVIGVPYLNIVKSDKWGTVGWDELTPFIQNVFKVEGLLFVLQLLILVFCFMENNITQKILSVSMVIYTYKMAVDPFIFLSYSSMDGGVYEHVKFYLGGIVILGLILHLIFLYHWVRKIKSGEYALNIRTDQVTNPPKKYSRFFVILTIVIFSGVLIRNFPDSGDILLLVVAIVMLITLSYAVCEFIFVAYCIFRFPSFAVNPPPQKKSQYVNPKNERKKKKRKKNRR